MEEKKNKLSSMISGSATSLLIKVDILFAILAYFVYTNSWEASLAIYGLTLIVGIGSAIGIIPIIGPILYLTNGQWLMAKYLALTHITPTWLTSTLYWLGFVQSLIITIVIIIVIIVIAKQE